MSISAISSSAVKAPSDASAVVVQVAIKQQKEFEATLQRANERREADLAAHQASLEASRREAEAAAKAKVSEKGAPVESAPAADAAVIGPSNASVEVRGAAVDVKV